MNPAKSITHMLHIFILHRRNEESHCPGPLQQPAPFRTLLEEKIITTGNQHCIYICMYDLCIQLVRYLYVMIIIWTLYISVLTQSHMDSTTVNHENLFYNDDFCPQHRWNCIGELLGKGFMWWILHTDHMLSFSRKAILLWLPWKTNIYYAVKVIVHKNQIAVSGNDYKKTVRI